GAAVLMDPKPHMNRLEDYVAGFVSRFGKHEGVLAFDIWNEPCNINANTIFSHAEPPNKMERVAPLLLEAFQWARNTAPQKPLTSGLWIGDWSDESKMNIVHRIQANQSDFITFHNYGDAADLETRIKQLQRYDRPIVITECGARPVSAFKHVLPTAKAHRVGALWWGNVKGRTQCDLSYTSHQTPVIEHRPKHWYHDVFNEFGRPHIRNEVKLIREMTGAPLSQRGRHFRHSSSLTA
nr:cellulase family glycosylhydrolase [Pseudomonadota bacterium]